MIRTDDVVRLAEQATLGSLLINPHHFAEVNTWLRGQDFTDPWHRQVWTLLREAHTAGAPLDALGLGAALRERLPAIRCSSCGCTTCCAPPRPRPTPDPPRGSSSTTASAGRSPPRPCCWRPRPWPRRPTSKPRP